MDIWKFTQYVIFLSASCFEFKMVLYGFINTAYEQNKTDPKIATQSLCCSYSLAILYWDCDIKSLRSAVIYIRHKQTRALILNE